MNNVYGEEEYNNFTDDILKERRRFEESINLSSTPKKLFATWIQMMTTSL